MPSNLETLYDILTVYHSHFEDLNSILVYFDERGMSLQASWKVEPNEEHPDGGQIQIVKFLSKEEMEMLRDEDGKHLEKITLDFIEGLHMKWEVGED